MKNILLFLVLFVVPFSISAQTIDFAELEKTIEAEIAATKTPGAALAIVSSDKIIFAKGFGTTNAENVKNSAASVIRPIDNNSAKYPGGSLFSSANELARFAAAMLNGGNIDGKQILPAFIVENLMKPQFYLPGEEKTFYGYGLLGFEDRSVKTVSHGGASRGYGSTIFFAPEQKIAVIVLANTSGQTLPKSRQKAMEMLLPFKKSAVNQTTEKFETSADNIKNFVSKYSHAPQIWEVFAKDRKLFIKDNGKDFELKKTNKNEFEYEQGSVIFVPNERGEIEHIFMGLYAARKISQEEIGAQTI